MLYRLFKSEYIRNAYFAWLALALFYAYQYMLRISLGVLENEIRTAYKATADQFGSLATFYLLGYSLLQIPLGVVVDKVGVKKMSMYSIVICIIGSMLFGLTEHLWVAQLSRLIIGIGSASAFMCAVKYIAEHFPSGSRAFLMGATLALGTIGALVSAKSTMLLENDYVWRDLIAASAAFGSVVFVLVAIFVVNPEKNPVEKLNTRSFTEILESIKQVVLSKNIMIYAIAAVGLYTPLSAISDVWGPVFIKSKFGLGDREADMINTLMYIGLTIGCIVMPWVSGKFSRINEAIVVCGFLVLAVFVFIVYLPPVDKAGLMVLLLLLGFFCGAEMMCFAGALSFSKNLGSGEVIGVVNTLNMLSGAILHKVIGSVLDSQWDGLLDYNGIRQYTIEQFVMAFSVLTLVLIVCCFISILLLRVKPRS